VTRRTRVSFECPFPSPNQAPKLFEYLRSSLLFFLAVSGSPASQACPASLLPACFLLSNLPFLCLVRWHLSPTSQPGILFNEFPLILLRYFSLLLSRWYGCRVLGASSSFLEHHPPPWRFLVFPFLICSLARSTPPFLCLQRSQIFSSLGSFSLGTFLFAHSLKVFCSPRFEPNMIYHGHSLQPSPLFVQ